MALQELLKKLDANGDGRLETSEVDKDRDGLFDLTSTNTLWTPKEYRGVEKTLFDHKLITKMRNSIPNEESPPQQTQFLYRLSQTGRDQDSGQVLTNIKGLYITFVHDGKPRSAFLTPDQLAHNNTLEINGWVTGVVVFSKEKLNANFNNVAFGQAAKQFDADRIALSDRQGSYTMLFPDMLAAVGLDEETKKSLFDNSIDENENVFVYLLGTFSNSYSYRGAPISDQADPFFTMNLPNPASDDPHFYHMQIRQATYHAWGNVDPNQNTIRVSDLSSAPHSWSQIQHFQEKVSAITEGIREVHEKLVDGLTTDLKLNSFKMNNASATYGDREIHFYYEIIKNSSPKHLQTVATHETLHKYIFSRRLSLDPKIRTAFVDLLGYKGKERDEILHAGGSAFGDYALNFENQAFFFFINESHYFQAKDLGHSHANIDEFLASFIHSLFDLDKLEENVKGQKTIEQAFFKKTIPMDDAARKAILSGYEKTLTAIIEALQKNEDLPKDQQEKEVDFFSRALEKVRSLKSSVSKNITSPT